MPDPSPANAPDRTWELLGIPADASFREARRAYRFASRANHPDRNPDDPYAAERFKAINLGWEQIGTSELWSAYQNKRQFHASGALQPSAPSRPAAAKSASTIRIERANAHSGSAVGWQVHLDGQGVGKVRIGKPMQIGVTPGKHQI